MLSIARGPNERRAATAFLVAVLASTTIASAPAASERPGEGVTVTPAVATWTSALPISWLYVELLEELGYDVREPVPLSNPVAFLAVTEGDIAYFPNAWFPFHEAQVPDGFDDKATAFEPSCRACAIQGYLVDIASIEAYDIEGISDFAERAAVRQAFDHTGDGRADLYGCPPGWSCHEAINDMINRFELGDHIHHVDSGYSANFAEVMSLFGAGEPVLYYTWGPSAWLRELVPGADVMWINVPGIIEDRSERAAGVEGTVTDPVRMGFPPNDIQVIANNGFVENNPAAAELFRRVEIPLEWISDVDARIRAEELRDREVRALARAWIEANRDRIDRWLEAARRAAENSE